MSDDYLFDPSSPPDPEVARLERALERFRLRDARPLRLRRVAPRAWLAAVVLAAAAAIVLLARLEAPWAVVRGDAAVVALVDARGAVRVVSGHEERPAGARPLERGDRIVCDAGAQARLRVGEIGWLTLEEQSRLHLVADRGGGAGEEEEGAWRLDLERGAVSARIFAAPRVFWLGTPSAIAVDLGCVYRTTVDDEGRATLSVTRGKVSFESDGRRVFVPAGASCRAWPGYGPGTPAWDGADAGLREAAVRHDEARIRGDAAAARRAVEELLTTDEERDTLTLWHLLTAPEPDLRADVHDRLRELCPPPAGVTRERCLAGDAAALASWREELEDEAW